MTTPDNVTSNASPAPMAMRDRPLANLLPDRIVVGLDGSVFGDRALPVARDLAAGIGAELTLLSIVEYTGEFANRATYLADLHAFWDAHLEVQLETDVRRALARRPPGDLLCLTTRGRSAVLRSLLGSTAFAEIAAGRPALLVGFGCVAAGVGGPILVPVGGGVDDDESIATAAAWAVRLGVAITVVTVASSADTRPVLDAGRATLEGFGLTAGAAVIEPADDPIRALARWCRSQQPSLVVAASSIESGQPRALLQSRIANLVGRVRAPVLVVPSATTVATPR